MNNAAYPAFEILDFSFVQTRNLSGCRTSSGIREITTKPRTSLPGGCWQLCCGVENKWVFLES